MEVLVINPIMYTSETKNIKRAASIKDTMMYDFCLAFHEMGHSVTLVGGEPFKPIKSETYPFGGSASVKKSACHTACRLCQRRISM